MKKMENISILADETDERVPVGALPNRQICLASSSSSRPDRVEGQHPASPLKYQGRSEGPRQHLRRID